MGKFKENGTGGSKKDAKREAAQKMIDKLKSLGTNGPEQVIIFGSVVYPEPEPVGPLSFGRIRNLF